MKLFSFLMLAAAVTGTPSAAPAQAQSAQTAKPQWLAVLSLKRAELLDPAGWSEADNQVVGAHFEYLKKLTGEGTVLLAGRTTDQDERGRMPADSMGLVIIEAEDRAAAERIMAADPAVQAGIFNVKLHSYRVALSR